MFVIVSTSHGYLLFLQDRRGSWLEDGLVSKRFGNVQGKCTKSENQQKQEFESNYKNKTANTMTLQESTESKN